MEIKLRKVPDRFAGGLELIFVATDINIYICLILSSGDVGDASSRSVMKPRKNYLTFP
jgi:hypothetical protein